MQHQMKTAKCSKQIKDKFGSKMEAASAHRTMQCIPIVSTQVKQNLKGKNQQSEVICNKEDAFSHNKRQNKRNRRRATLLY